MTFLRPKIELHNNLTLDSTVWLPAWNEQEKFRIY